jgi:hypothetical protein
MNSDKLEKIKEDLMGKGEDYPLKTCIMEWAIWMFYEGISSVVYGDLTVFMEFWQRMF